MRPLAFVLHPLPRGARLATGMRGCYSLPLAERVEARFSQDEETLTGACGGVSECESKNQNTTARNIGITTHSLVQGVRSEEANGMFAPLHSKNL